MRGTNYQKEVKMAVFSINGDQVKARPANGVFFTNEEQQALLVLGFTIFTINGKDEATNRVVAPEPPGTFGNYLWGMLNCGLGGKWVPVLVHCLRCPDTEVPNIKGYDSLTVTPIDTPKYLFDEETAENLNKQGFMLVRSKSDKTEQACITYEECWREYKRITGEYQ